MDVSCILKTLYTCKIMDGFCILHWYICCVYTKESLVYTQEISCACTTLLCVLWARDPRGQRPKEAAVQGLGPAQLPLWVPGPSGPWPRASTRVLCMHKRSLVYTQEILLGIHNKCILILSYHIIVTVYYIIIRFLYYYMIISFYS